MKIPIPPPQAAPVIHVVDDDDAVRQSLQFLLQLEHWPVALFASGAALLAADLPRRGCVLTDFQMPGMDGLQLQAQLAQRGISLPVIVMTAHADVPVAVRAMKAGAVDFLQKPFAEGQLLEAVERALARNAAEIESEQLAAAATARLALLTPREREVLDQLVSGKSNKEIAKILGTSPRTIDVHRARVQQKLNAPNLPALVHIARAAAAPA